jgi:predicted DNA-binding transcriptional regulator AlpA
MEAAPDDRALSELMDGEAVCAFFGNIHRATLHRGVTDGRFPQPIKIGHLSRWSRRECAAALAEMAASRKRKGEP